MKSILMNCLLVVASCLMMSCNSNQKPSSSDTVPATEASKAIAAAAAAKAATQAGTKVESETTTSDKQVVVQNLKPEQFVNILRGNSSAIVLDVRTPRECKGGIYENAIMLNYNDGTFDAKLKDLDKSTAYLLYCASGVRSAKAAKKMVDLGFEKVYNLKGGYKDIK